MAKPPKNDPQGRIKVRIIEFEMDGNDESMQEGLKTFAAALNRGNATAARVRNEPSRRLESSAPAPAEEVEDVEEVEVEEAPGPPAPRRTSGTRKPAKVVPASVLKDVRLDDVEPTFVDFATQKNPSSDLAKYLVVAYWFKFFKDTPDLTGDHFYTAFRLMQWDVPSNVIAPASELRSSRNGKFSTGDEKGTFTINQVGENAVNKMGGQ